MSRANSTNCFSPRAPTSGVSFCSISKSRPRCRPAASSSPRDASSASGWKPRRSRATAKTSRSYLAHSLHIPRAQARRIAGDDLGEPIVTAAKALTMPRDVVYRILLFVNTTVGHSVERVHALAALYDEMPTASRRTYGRDLAGIAQHRARRDARIVRWHGTTRRAPAPGRRPRRCAARRRRNGPASAATFPDPRYIAANLTMSRKLRPARSSTSTIQTSGSNFISRAR